MINQPISSPMIIGISDGVSMTNIVGKKETTEAEQHYRNFYLKHCKILVQKWSKCNWKIIKTTGDGLFFSSKAESNSNYLDYFRSVIELYNEINYDDQKSRLFVYLCDSEKVIEGKRIATDNTTGYCMNFMQEDLFGHELNLGFRLLGLASGASLFTEDNFLIRVFPDKVCAHTPFNHHLADINTDIQFTPIPVTFLKGIAEVGFTSQKFNGKKKKPRWIWEIQY